MKNLYQLVDANVNRVSEGMRVLEDLCRYQPQGKQYAKILRELRHELRKTFDDQVLIQARNTRSDHGITNTREDGLDKKTSLEALFLANFKRVQEGLRSIEEVSKVILDQATSKKIESMRYRVYDLEKNLARPKMETSFVYLILNEGLSGGKTNYQVCQEALEAGVRIIQYREKDKDKGDQERECVDLLKLIKSYGGQLIINDHIDIALAIGAHGVHLGQEDMSIAAAKRIGPNLLVGRSTHTIDQARQAQAEGADYIGVGPIFKTTTKLNVEASEGMAFLDQVAREIEIPYVAIGGIKTQDVQAICKKGAKAAMISEIVASEDIGSKIHEILKEINHG